MIGFFTIWRTLFELALCRFYFGGSSKSSTASTSSQTYTDQRVANQDGQAQSGGMFNTNADNHSTNVSDSGNTNTLSYWLQQLTSNTNLTSNSSNQSSVNDSGNWTSSNQSSVNDSGNWTSNSSNQSSSNITDSGNWSSSSADSHNSSSSMVLNYAGVDPGMVRIAELQQQLLHANGEQQLDAVKAIAGLGANIGGAATDLAALSQSNSMRLSEHMLDLTGELIDKLATGTSNAVATQGAIARATADQVASSQAGAVGMSKTLLIVGGVVAAALIFH